MSKDPEDTAPAAQGSNPLQGAVERLLGKAADQVRRVADDGRLLIRIHGLQRDMDAFWVRLGKTAFRLAEAGEVDHPALTKAVERIMSIEAEIDRMRASLADEALAEPAQSPATED